jgi:hypothetical protein
LATRSGPSLTEGVEPASGAAVFSPCRRFRYRLERRIGDGPGVAVVMVNPSAADGARDDPTIRRVVQFARREGWGRVVVVNLFALIASRIEALAEAPDVVGPDNPRHLAAALAEAERCVVAWGRLSKLPPRLRGAWREVHGLARDAGRSLHCWGVTRSGDPRHPLFLPRDTPLQPWRAPDCA